MSAKYELPNNGTLDLGDTITPCRENDPELWYAESPSRILTLEQIEAKRLCGLCPALTQCRTWARTNREQFGIWGGETPQERNGQKAIEPPAKCGTPRGYSRHLTKAETTCQDCRDAVAAQRRAERNAS